MNVLLVGCEEYNEPSFRPEKSRIVKCLSAADAKVELGRQHVDCVCLSREGLRQFAPLVDHLRKDYPWIPILAILDSEATTGAATEESWALWAGLDAGVAWHLGPRWVKSHLAQQVARRRALARQPAHPGKPKISVSSRHPRGTRIEVRFPIAGPLCASSAPPTSRPEPVQVKRLKILLIDDEPLLLRGCKRMLNDHDVVVAQGGLEGTKALEHTHNFDLILCDLMMPDMDGVQVHQWLTEQRHTLAERFAFCSGGALTARIRQYITHHNVLTIEKPVNPNAVALAACTLREQKGEKWPSASEAIPNAGKESA